MNAATESGHRSPLDSLRAVAVLIVFLFHLDEKRFTWGKMGVALFFVLSGFLITRLLLLHESGRLGRDLGVFYARRMLRIFPLYYAVLVVLWPVGVLSPPGPGWYFLYLHNVYLFWYTAWTGVTNHFWSLCVEEQFYMLYPLLLLGLPPRWRAAALGLLLAGSIAIRLYLDAVYPDARSWALLPVAGEYLLWGSLAGLVEFRRGTPPLPTGSLMGIGLLLYLVATVDQFGPGRFLERLGWEGVYPTAHGIGFALLVLGLWHLDATTPNAPLRILHVVLSLPVLVYLGRISYGLYVFHNFSYGVKDWLLVPFPWLAPIPGAVIALVATVGMAVLSWHLLEQPILRLKDRFRYQARPEVV